MRIDIIKKAIYGMINERINITALEEKDSTADIKQQIAMHRDNYNFFEKALAEELQSISDRFDELDHRTSKLRTLR